MPIREDNKAFLLMNGTPLIVHVLRALETSEHVGRAIIVGPAERLRQTLDRYDRLKDLEIHVMEQRDTLLENAKAGFVAALPGVLPDTSLERLRNSRFTDKYVLFLPCDIPLLTSFEVDEFVEKADMDRFDYCAGVTSEETLSAYYPKSSVPGIRMAYFHLKEGRFRHNNLHMVKPLKASRLSYVETLYRMRYQKRLGNILKMIIVLLFTGKRLLTSLRLFLQLQTTLRLDMKGKRNWLYELLRRATSTDRIVDTAHRIVGIRMQAVDTSYGGAALDIDNAKHLAIAEKMEREWNRRQTELRDRYNREGYPDSPFGAR